MGNPLSNFSLTAYVYYETLFSLGISQVPRRYSNGRGQVGQSTSGSMNIFDRGAKRKQKNRAAVADDVATYDYLRDEVCDLCLNLFDCL